MPTSVAQMPSLASHAVSAAALTAQTRSMAAAQEVKVPALAPHAKLCFIAQVEWLLSFAPQREP